MASEMLGGYVHEDLGGRQNFLLVVEHAGLLLVAGLLNLVTTDVQHILGQVLVALENGSLGGTRRLLLDDLLHPSFVHLR